MPAGLQIWDAAGRLQVDISTKLYRFIGAVSSGTSAGSIANDGLYQGTPFSFSVLSGSAGFGAFGPIVTFSGNVMSWSFKPGTPAISATIFYGVS